MRFKRTTQTFLKKTLGMALVAVLVGFPATGAQALSLRPPGVPSIPMPSGSSFASDIERRYHVNTGEVQEQGETLNVSDGKKVTPEVSIFFSPSDPEEGQKLTARAFPIYFSGKTAEMYYTWYLQRNGCEENVSPSGAQITACDRDGNGRVDYNDWKIEAARIQASNNFEYGYANYAVADTDNDGYRARFGGDSKVNVNNYCYYHDNTSGENYEIVGNAEEPDFNCNTGLQPVCMNPTTTFNGGTIDISAGGGTGTGGGSGSGSSGSGTGEGSGTGTGGSATASGSFLETGYGNDTVTGLPYCTSTGTVGCITGTPCCVANPSTATDCTQNISGGQCSVASRGDSNPVCRHLFPDASGYTSGDSTFPAGEEQFWRTDPADPDTADNGNKDEANVVGLGRDSFMWNYTRGDKLGVAVEGTSMIPTKHADSTNMIMWAFSKNHCPIALAPRGSYQQNIRGYDVVIPTIEIDLDDCLKHNLVDPMEGGQATNLEVNLTATPNDPLNDTGLRTSNGDTLSLAASLNNSVQDTERIYYDWKVYLSRDGTIAPSAGWENITGPLLAIGDADPERRLVSPVKGNGVKNLTLKLNLKASDNFGGRSFTTYTPGGIGYLRFQLDVAENFNAGGANRRGKTDIIVKFTSTSDRIAAYAVDVAGDPARLTLSSREICSGVVNPADPPERQVLSRLDAKLCRVIKNEIIGLKVDATGGLSNYNWTINGQPLVCNSQVSPNCNGEQQGDINFFPIIGNAGDVFTVSVTTNRVDTASSAQKAVTLSRSFKIVEPELSIVSGDEATAWPKLLGRYTDTNGGTYDDYSKTTLQAFSGATVNLRALFTPDFLGTYLPPQIERSWTVDGQPAGDGTSNAIAFTAGKPPESIYNVALTAVYRPSALTRKAMQDIWDVSNLDSTEIFFNTESQIEHPADITVVDTGTNRYLALLSSYLPAPLLFTIRIFLSVGLIIFVTGFLFALIPNAPRSAYGRVRE